MEFVSSQGISLSLLENQWHQLSSRERIKNAIGTEGVFAYDILLEGQVIGFAMLRQFAEDSYFLWNFAIDVNFQRKGLGKQALHELMTLIKERLGGVRLTTTYLVGNDRARHLYEALGFIETSRVDEEDCQEVNMEILF